MYYIPNAIKIMRNSFLGARQLPRKLVPGSVPSIFPCSSTPMRRTLAKKLEQKRESNDLLLNCACTVLYLRMKDEK